MPFDDPDQGKRLVVGQTHRGNIDFPTDIPINVRAGPGTNYAVIGTAAPGEQFAITDKSPGAGDWWQINYDGRTGWVYRPLVTATNAQDVQVVDPP